ncbi:MAG: pseudouridine synthase [Lachnospiraceae bacterium]|jgi:23S rRNA pseudouridine2604 synthase|nr:pseudouridine synthase [Lachnospiraceae bacterium]
MEKIRLNKYIAQAGVCSRRDADSLIDKGLVSVNGQTANMGMRVDDSDRIIVNGKEIKGRNEKIVLAYYKPVGITCTEKDRFAAKKIMDEVKYPIRLTYAGRLDKESEGLMILTNDGDLIHAMMRGANRHEKEYIVKVKEEITPEFIEGLQAGVYLPELHKTTRPCKAEKIGKYTFRITLTQGLNRQIRYMCKAFEYHVFSLKRVRIMNIGLETLHPGEWRVLTEAELTALYTALDFHDHP